MVCKIIPSMYILCLQVDRKRSKEDREFVSRLKVISRFMTPEENEALVEGLLNSRKLMRNIEQYRVYRSMGIRTVEQVSVSADPSWCETATSR